jgi:hypothetical protein
MNKPMKMILNVVRLLVAIQIGMGILMWMGKGANLVNMHMGFGLLFVVLAVAFAVMGKAAGAPPSLTWVTIIWGIVVVVVGMEQARVMVGDSHWVIQLIHLLLGLGLAAQVERIGRAVKTRAGA